MSQRRLLLVFGGRSAEHEVSIRSAREVLAAIDRAVFEPVLLGVSKTGEMRTGPVDVDLSTLVNEGQRVNDVLALLPDVVFSVLHGPYGEDGCFQGFLETLNVPYVGPGVRASALCMDKAVLKRLLASWDIPQVPWLELRRGEIEQVGMDAITQRVETELGFPCFVKPANMGSSVGVHAVRSALALEPAVQDALRFDDKLVVEKGVDAPRELELAVLGNGGTETKVSPPGEIVVPQGKFYDYETKYVTDDAQLILPAVVDAAVVAEMQRIALQVFRAVECRGLCRMDFLVERQTGQVFFNEPNTLPGFTSISMYPKLIGLLGIEYSQLITHLCELALAEHARKARLAN